MSLMKQVFQDGSDPNFPDDYYPSIEALKQAVAGQPRYDYTFAGVWADMDPRYAKPLFESVDEPELVGVAF